jgi:hypothetical protein
MAGNLTSSDTDVSSIQVDDKSPVYLPPYTGGDGSVASGAPRQLSNFLSDIDASTAKVQRDLVGPAQDAQKAQTAADRQRDDDTKKDRERMDLAWGNESARADDPALQVWDADKEKANRTRGPMEQFGSVGFIFAMAASAFTRTPMTSALNAGAAAMTAIQQGDEKAYEHAYKAWKDNSDLAIRRFDMEHRLYEDADKLMTTDMNLWKQKTLQIAAQFDDHKKIAMLQNGMDSEVLKSRESLIKSAAEVRKEQQRFEEYNTKKDLYTSQIEAWKNDPEHPERKKTDDKNPTPEYVMAKLQAWHNAMDPAYRRSMSPEQQYIAQRTQEIMTEKGASQTEAMFQAEQEWKTRPANTQPTLAGEKAQVIEKAKAEFRASHDGREPNAEETKEIVDKATRGPDKPTLTDEEATFMAQQHMAGDKSVLQNMARGTQGQANLIFIRKKEVELAKEQGLSPSDLATKMAEYAGLMRAESTLGQRTANVELFNNEALNMMEIAQQKSHEVPRTQFPSINRALLAYERHFGDPKIVAFGAAINTMINTYAKAISGGQGATVSDKDHAREIIKDADTPEQFDAVINVLKQELQAARRAPGQVREELRERSGGGSTLEQGKVPTPTNVIRYDAQGNRI